MLLFKCYASFYLGLKAYLPYPEEPKAHRLYPLHKAILFGLQEGFKVLSYPIF